MASAKKVGEQVRGQLLLVLMRCIDDRMTEGLKREAEEVSKPAMFTNKLCELSPEDATLILWSRVPRRLGPRNWIYG